MNKNIKGYLAMCLRPLVTCLSLMGLSFIAFSQSNPPPPPSCITKTWYKDGDNDGYSDGTFLTLCSGPTGYKLATGLTAISGDCDDDNDAINPGANEVFNGVDDNCDGLGTYSPTILISGTNTSIIPSEAPTNTTSLVAYTNSNFTGVLSADPATGVVTVTNAKQAGVYTVTVQAFNGLDPGVTETFQLTVTNPNCSAGQFGAKTDFGTGLDGSFLLSVGDFNSDGNQDLVVPNYNSNTVSILLGDGAGAFGLKTDYGTGNNPISVSVGDFNGDGKQDLAMANSAIVSILLGDGAGGFGANTDFAAGDDLRSLSVGDFNGDGKQDLGVVNNNSNTVSILLGDGAGAFADPIAFATSDYPVALTVGDFNGDGNQDLAVTTDGLTKTVSILLGNGGGYFAEKTDFGIGNNPTSVSVGDFNGDGKQDLAVANAFSNTVSILLGVGDGTFLEKTDYAFSDFDNPFSVSVGDFNGDGNQDLAVANISSNTVSILLGDGAGAFAARTDFGTGDQPFSVLVGDFNGDGKQDLVTANPGSNNVSLLLGQDMVWYLDNDNDHYYTGVGVTQCTSPGTGYKTTGLTGGGDCNDANAAVNPAGFSCLDGSILGLTTISCFGDFTVKLTAAGSGGSAPYTYLWSTGQSGAVINNASAGTYSVTITDGIGQTKVASHTISGPTAVSATLVITNQKCEDPAKGTIVANGMGGTPGYQYALNFGAWQNSGTFNMVPPGRHTINIKDGNGCLGKVSALVTKLASSMTLSAVRTGISSCGGTGTITATAGGGVAPYQYKLGDAGSYQSSGTFSGLAAGSYKIIAKDNIGCTVSRTYNISDNGKDAFESNNAIGAAKNISLNTNVVARIGTATDQDWFKFNTGSAGDFDITLSHGTVNYNLQLFTNAGGLITPVSQTGNTISYTGLEFATYRIQITGAQSFNCYNLMVAPAPPVVTGAEMLTSKTVAPDELKAQAFPNPHSGSFILQVESPVSGKGSIVLYDLQGRTMVTREENLRAGTNQVRFSNLQPINYFYRVMVGGKSTSGKVFKQ